VPRKLEVACIGPEWSFSDEAARFWFPEAKRRLVKPDQLVATVEAVSCDFGLMPFWNATGVDAHPIPRLLTALATSAQTIAVEVVRFPVVWAAMAHGPFSAAKTLYLSAQAIKQCSRWINTAAAHCRRVKRETTSEAAASAQRDSTGIALGSRGAALNLGFKNVASGVQDHLENATWFFVLGRRIHADHDRNCHAIVAKRGGPAISEVAVLPEPRWVIRTAGWLLMELGTNAENPVIRHAVRELEQERAQTRVLGCYADYDRHGMVRGSQT
jgi:prephenate dehydratase